MKKLDENQEEHFIINAFKSSFPTLIGIILGAIVTIFSMRTDNAVFAKRLDTLESNSISRDLVAQQFAAVNKRLDSIDLMINSFSAKLDRHIER